MRSKQTSIGEEQRRTATGSLVGRTVTYNAMDWTTSVSEAGAPGFTTSYQLHDAFGRPGRIRPPDGSAHDVLFTYLGDREVTRQASIGTAWTGTAVIESLAATVETYDAEGRLLSVLEPSGPSGGNVTTTYTRDVGGRVTAASTSSAGTTQTRSFGFDNLGLLLWENHPEKTANSFGMGHDVDYPAYNAIGNVLRRADGTNDLTLVYDEAMRLTLIRETAGGQRALKEFTYAPSNGAGERSLGKLRKAIRHNRFNLCGTGGAHDAAIEETYTYAGIDGGVSKRDTVLRVSYGYSNGWVTSVPGYASAVSYLDSGLWDKITRANGVIDTQLPDPNRIARPLSISAAAGATALWTSGGYGYDGAGNITRASAGYTIYDKVSRLVEGKLFLQAGGASGGTRIQRPTYDAFGNIKTLSTQIDVNPPVPRDVATNSATNRVNYFCARIASEPNQTHGLRPESHRFEVGTHAYPGAHRQCIRAGLAGCRAAGRLRAAIVGLPFARRAHGFHTADALISMIVLDRGGILLDPPFPRPPEVEEILIRSSRRLRWAAGPALPRSKGSQDRGSEHATEARL